MKIRSYLSFVIFFLFTLPLSAQIVDSLNVLFIGNSYTHRNSLPQMFVDLAESAGKKVIIGQSTDSGSLESHSTHNATLNAISKGTWDYVIIQEQSQIPTIEHFRLNSMYPSARLLDSLITAYGANTVFYMTWGRKYGGQQIRQGYYSPDFTDFYQMQTSLQLAYEEIGKELKAIVAPVGKAWAYASMIDRSVDLWTDDNSHPTIKGSYLAACIFFTVLFKESPEGLSFTSDLSSEDAVFFQNIGYQTVANVTAIKLSEKNISSYFSLFQNFPNPFNPNTKIKFQIPNNNVFVSLKVFDLLGKEVTTLVEENKLAGNYEMEFNAAQLNSGIYFYTLSAGEFTQTNKMILMK